MIEMRESMMQWMKKILALWLFVPSLFAAEAAMEIQELAFVEGKQYRLVAPQAMQDPTVKALLAEVPKNQVGVWQFFNYGCPVCSREEPLVSKWYEEKKSQNLVDFVDIPVAWTHPGWDQYARAFYIAQALSEMKHKKYENVLKEGHHKIFFAVHSEGEDLSTQEKLRTFFQTQLSVQPKDFDAVYNSFDVRRRMKQSELMAKAYDIRAIPSFVVAGKYYTDVQMSGGLEQLVDVVNFLVNKETFTSNTQKIDFDPVKQ